MFLVLAASVALLGAPADLVSVTPRCNDVVASDIQSRVDAIDTPAAAAPKNAKNNLELLLQIDGDGETELRILQQVCSDDDAPRVEAPLYAAFAQSALLQGDMLATGLNEHDCARVGDVQRAFVAGAWYDAVRAYPQAGAAPQGALAALVARVRARAAQLSLTLPAPADTTYYWRTQQSDLGHDALASCIK